MKRLHNREHVYDELESRIHRGFYVPGDRFPSERTIAEELGTSRAAVRVAIQRLVKAGHLVQEVNCRPVIASRKTSPSVTRPSKVVAWIRPDLRGIGEWTVLQSIRSHLEQSGYSLIVALASTEQSREQGQSEIDFLRELIGEPDVAGAIVWETCETGLSDIYPTLRERRIPLVFVDREPFQEIEADVVMTNNRRGARKVLSHLIGLGHRKIAMITNDEPSSSARDRVRGYRDALEEAMIPFDPDLVLRLSSDDLEVSDTHYYARLIDNLVARTPGLTAIFCVNDGIALKVQQALADCGVRVPEQISLAGFDWLLRLLPSGGDLTTVAQPFQAIGRIASERLVNRIEGDPADPARHIFIEAPLVVRTTTGMAPATHLPDQDLVLTRCSYE